MPSLSSQPRRVREALEEFRAQLERRWGTELVGAKLFGSRVRGEADAASDVDVAVVLERVGWAEQCEVIDMATDIGLERDLLISPTVFDRATYERWKAQGRPLVADIEREGIALTDEGRQEAVAAELAAADEELRAADLLAAQLPRIAITRAYFAVFHAIRALLYAEDLAPRTHEGTHHLFNVHFIKTGRFPPATSRLIARLQKFREQADHAQAFVVDAEGAAEEIRAARELVERVRAMTVAG